MDYGTLGFAVFHYLSEFTQILVHWISGVHSINDAICCSLLLLPSIFSSIRLFSNELALCLRCRKVLQLQHQSFHVYSGLISFRIDWFDLLAVQGTLKSLLQHHSLKLSILWCSAFVTIQLSHLYMTTGKTIALTIQTFFSKVISLLF